VQFVIDGVAWPHGLATLNAAGQASITRTDLNAGPAHRRAALPGRHNSRR